MSGEAVCGRRFRKKARAPAASSPLPCLSYCFHPGAATILYQTSLHPKASPSVESKAAELGTREARRPIDSGAPGSSRSRGIKDGRRVPPPDTRLPRAAGGQVPHIADYETLPRGMHQGATWGIQVNQSDARQLVVAFHLAGSWSAAAPFSYLPGGFAEEDGGKGCCVCVARAEVCSLTPTAQPCWQRADQEGGGKHMSQKTSLKAQRRAGVDQGNLPCTHACANQGPGSVCGSRQDRPRV